MLSKTILEIKKIETNQPPYLNNPLDYLTELINEFILNRPDEQWHLLNINFREPGSNLIAFIVRYDE